MGVRTAGRQRVRSRVAYRWVLGALLLVGAGAIPAGALGPRDYVVPLSASVTLSPPAIRLHWPPASGGSGITVQRKLLESGTWLPLAALPPQADGYVDWQVAPGQTWEYRVIREGSSPVAYGYLLAGLDAPARDVRGAVLLVVDNRQAGPLAPELRRLEDDLTADGWRVRRIDVAPEDSPAGVKSRIVAAHQAAPLTTVFLLGRVPVPYSGNFAPDGHSDHAGAWPADLFYGDLDGHWSDTSVFRISATDSRHHNVPGDGKYDPSSQPSDVELEIGRVDFSNLPAFGLSETELLRRYLDKNHRFRHRRLTVVPRALIDDRFGDAGGLAYAQTAWRGFAPLVGADRVTAQTWNAGLAAESALWAYGASSGWYTNCEGVVSTGDFATRAYPAVFTLLFGSYFGDWDARPNHYSQNNLMRAALGSGDILACGWAGRPLWLLHPMGLGGHIGQSLRLTQNHTGTRYPPASIGMRQVHVALMGDPTLRQYYVAPPSNLTARVERAPSGGEQVRLDWAPATEAVRGYRLYRAAAPRGPYTRIGPDPIVGTTYTDLPPSGQPHYLVRALTRVTSPSGTYDDLSQGAYAKASPWQGALVLPDDWRYVSWFGYVYAFHEPWNYHWEHGWLYTFGLTPDHLWFWDGAMRAYWWTSAGFYPYIYRSSDGAWLWYLKGSMRPRFFYNFTTRDWESSP